MNSIPEYRVDEQGKVIFCFPKSPELYEAVASYTDGGKLNAYEFAFKIKRVRADMLMRKNQLKEQANGNRQRT